MLTIYVGKIAVMIYGKLSNVKYLGVLSYIHWKL